MNELTRHASVGRSRRRARGDQPSGLPQLYASRRRRLPDLFLADRAEARRGGRFRWFFSTCLAAGVGAIAIGAVILGSLGANVGDLPPIPRVQSAKPQPAVVAPDGLKWATPKSDRLQTTSGAMSTKYVVQDSLSQRRVDRNYIEKRFYARIAVRLAAVPATTNAEIPPFNPFKLYSGGGPAAGEGDRDGNRAEAGFATVRHVELVGSILPPEDGQEIDSQEIVEIVQRSSGSTGLGSGERLIRPSFVPEGTELAIPKPGQRSRAAPEPVAPNTTVLEKTLTEPDEIADETEGQQVRVKVRRGESIAQLLQSMGADAWQAREMVDKAKSILPESAIVPGFEVEMTMVPSLTNAAKLEPMRFAVFDEAREHKVTVGRNGAGDFVASASPIDTTRANPADGDRQTASLYTSLYHAALAQGLSPDTILQILRVHAYETDFRRRARGSDSVDLFFDLKEEGKAADNPPAELLSTAITISGETQRYFRFRTPDGVIDYYDANGNNSRKFLMRKPVRSEEARFVSGYGMRRHPLLNQVRMHTGIDYAAPMGTPILAAGNGVIEEQGHKGQNGNYTRIRHANGYQTTYSHMTGRWPPDVHLGSKVRQGQIIGYLGNTGLSTGPHLHFEILVSSRFVDPMSIQMPKDRKLTGKQLADFQRERARIEDLMHRPPVRVAQLDAR